MRLRLAVTLLLVAVSVAPLPARAASVALVLAIDVSGSISSGRYTLQREGIARAFESPQLLKAIGEVPGGIEALVMEWSDPDQVAVTVGWTRISTRAAAVAFAAEVRATRRTSHGLTALGSAMLAAGAAFDHMPEPAARRVVDISGDGSANTGDRPADARDLLVKRGITVNGLAILTEEPSLDEYYRKNVIGGPSSFVLVARNLDSVAAAIQNKLVQEVAAASPAIDTVERLGAGG